MTPPTEQAIPVLRVTDAARSTAWYERLGFQVEWQHRFAPELPVFVEIARGHVRLFLSEHEGDARPDTLVYLRVGEPGPLAAELGVTAVHTEWGTLEFEVCDPDGNRLRVGTPLTDD